MIRRMRVVRAPAVEEWLAAPHKDERQAQLIRTRFMRAVRAIEQAGTLVGDDFLKKLPGYESLFETTVGDRRVFSTIVGNVVVMAVVVGKKKKRLAARELQPIALQVRQYAERWSESEYRQGGG